MTNSSGSERKDTEPGPTRAEGQGGAWRTWQKNRLTCTNDLPR